MKYVLGFLSEVKLLSNIRGKVLFTLLNKKFKIKYDFYVVMSLNELYEITKSPKSVRIFLDELRKKNLIKEVKKPDHILAHYNGKSYRNPIVLNITPLATILNILAILSCRCKTVKEKQVRHSIYTTFIDEIRRRKVILPALLTAFNRHKKVLSPNLKKAFGYLVITYKNWKLQET